MDEGALTSKAIAELMREMQGQTDATASTQIQERKINPLRKTNKLFLGRTINTALRHNKREVERTQANCQQKLQELDDRKQRRKTNSYFNGSGDHDKRRIQRRHKRRQRSRSRRSSSNSPSPCRSRSRSRKKKCKKKRKKHTKDKDRDLKQRRRSKSHQEDAPDSSQIEESNTVQNYYVRHSNNMALAVAMAYGQALYTQAATTDRTCTQDEANNDVPASPISDIMRELMSEAEEPTEPLIIPSTSESDGELFTIDVSSTGSVSDSSEKSSDVESCRNSCISLDDSNAEAEPGSDVEFVESGVVNSKESENVKPNQEEEVITDITTVDLTDNSLN
ncbi:serine/arginine-rich splicing factor 11 [Scaptodrosophila lebanonensis]|uniref:Serine/arginine-rich splicing factor 11 n=1 Tax=Drosophila lebanonensis TaxID=7225 RepID=A0A6J2UFS2_DROLE|nr:serine/arginine-rich splicing factor 11 [Scaptodrosophila lebanonensis]